MSEVTKEVSPNEIIKEKSNHLRGGLAEGLRDTTTEGFAEPEKQILKFHGIYQQKDRDKTRDEAGELVQKPHTFMLRGRIPGGHLTSEQYLVWDTLGDQFGGGSLRLTTRQSVQLHGLLKGDLKSVVQKIDEIRLSSIGACGDVVRNVTQAVNPWGNAELHQLDSVASLLSDHFKYKTNAYTEIWLDGEQINKEEEDPIYGKTYLPRKFKIAVTLAGNNSVDIYTNDMAFAATLNDDKQIDGYFVFAGGGLGMTHNKADTFPRKADLLGWIPESALLPVAEGIVTSHRDYGDRKNRKHARLKYVLADKGVEWFRAEVEKRAGIEFSKRELPEWNTPSYLGWIEREDGTLSLGFHTLAGRIKDFPGKPLKSALREIISQYELDVQVTADQDLILLGIQASDKEAIGYRLAELNIDPFTPSALYDKALACPALPTCPLAISESERVFPGLLLEIQASLEKFGLSSKAPVVRMTGCPNGCARPYSAEIGIVGQQAGNKYTVFLGGNHEGTELGEAFCTKTPLEEIPQKLELVFQSWKDNGTESERLGEYLSRVGLNRVLES